MDSLIHKINLDCLRKDSQAIVNTKIGEASGRKIVFTLYEGRAPFFVPSDTTVIFRAKKPSGAVLYNYCVVDDGKIEYTITSQTVAEKGVFPCEIQIIGADSKVIYTPCITLNVTENLYSDTEVESSNEFTELENALNKIPPLEVIYSKYTKPESGIPKSDLAQDVQNSLNKADTALQEHQSLAAYRTAEAQDLIDSTKQDKLIAGENITIAADGKTISATGVGVLEVTLTTQNGVDVADKTFEQVKAAVDSGIPVLKVYSDGAISWFFLLDKSPIEIDFVGFVDEQIIAYLTAKQDNTWETTVAARVTAEMLSSLNDKVGNIGQLTTTDKTNLVAAVNEVKQTTDSKQDKLIAGENITIAADGKTISATGGSSVPKPLTYDYMPEGYPTKAMGTVTVMEEQEVAFSSQGQVYGGLPTNAFEVVVDQTYTVNWDGTEYECVCFALNSIPVLGNLSIYGAGNDTGEPFIYAYNSNMAAGGFSTSDTAATHTISVKTKDETIIPMSEEFIPNMNVSAFTNDAGYLTLATLPKYGGEIV